MSYHDNKKKKISDENTVVVKKGNVRVMTIMNWFTLS